MDLKEEWLVWGTTPSVETHSTASKYIDDNCQLVSGFNSKSTCHMYKEADTGQWGRVVGRVFQLEGKGLKSFVNDVHSG
jgi:hypothetical protein